MARKKRRGKKPMSKRTKDQKAIGRLTAKNLEMHIDNCEMVKVLVAYKDEVIRLNKIVRGKA